MPEKEPRNDIREKRDQLLKAGWVDIKDGREEGRFLRYGGFDKKSNIIHAFYSGASTAGDEYGSFLVWNCKAFDRKLETGSDEKLRTTSETLTKEGWKVRTGVVTEVTLTNAGKEAGQNILVAIRRKEKDGSGTPFPSEDERKRVGGPSSLCSR